MGYDGRMTKGLVRYQQAGDWHFLTFSCYRRQPCLITKYEFAYNLNGQRTTAWDGNTLAELRNQYYWGSTPIAWYDSNTHFQHQNYMGTERIQTSYNGVVEGTYTSLAFGDALTGAGTGSDAYTGASAVNDAYHFAGLDHDYESNTEHAEFRNYSSTQGRWLAPDPYDGSYDITNPQSLNGMPMP